LPVIASHILAPRPQSLRTLFAAAAACLLLGIYAGSASAADLHGGWGNWWLPPNRSEHGGGIDSLFRWIFWITMVTFVLVEVALIVFLIRYRYRADRTKAYFTHGNTRLEMAWTIAPAIILAVLALGSKQVWDNYRYSPGLNDPNRATILVIGQQFQWNVVYPGPDGKLGRYLVYPKPTDLKWPDGKQHSGVAGPAFLPREKAISAINGYIKSNPIGKDFSDPDGTDDDWSATAGREINVPANRPVEVQLSSIDVIHSFYLPNFRVKLDAVPGMRGRVPFVATMTSAEREQESRRIYPIEELDEVFSRNARAEYTIVINEQQHTEGAEEYKPPRGRAFWRYADENKRTIARDGMPLSPESVQALKAAGISEVWAFEPGYWDIVCAELCGLGHSKMQGRLVVLDQDEYARRFEGRSQVAASE
jgi:heme/copper-type cytochrome/quinol oxidase subunit 2